MIHLNFFIVNSYDDFFMTKIKPRLLVLVVFIIQNKKEIVKLLFLVIHLIQRFYKKRVQVPTGKNT